MRTRFARAAYSPTVAPETRLDPNDETAVHFIVRTNRGRDRNPSAQFAEVVTKLGVILDYRKAHDPLLNEREYFRLLALEALSLDDEPEGWHPHYESAPPTGGYDLDSDIPF